MFKEEKNIAEIFLLDRTRHICNGGPQANSTDGIIGGGNACVVPDDSFLPGQSYIAHLNCPGFAHLNCPPLISPTWKFSNNNALLPAEEAL